MAPRAFEPMSCHEIRGSLRLAAPSSNSVASSGSFGRRCFALLTDRIVAADPAFSRLRFASRAVLSLLIAAVPLGLMSYRAPLPIAAYGVSVMICFVGSTAIRDRGQFAQVVSRLAGGSAAVGAVLLSSLLASRPLVADAVFLAVIFAAVFLRSFGGRWFAVGMMAFMAYFLGEFLRPEPGEIGWVALSVAIALAVTHAVTNYLLPSRPEEDFRRAAATVEHRVNLILRDLMSRSEAVPDSRRERRAFLRQILRLRRTVLMAEGFLSQGADGAPTPEGVAADLAISLYQLEIAVERVVRARFAGTLPESLLKAVLHRDPAALAAARKRIETSGADDADFGASTLLRLHGARARFEQTLAAAPLQAFAAPAGPPAIGAPTPQAVHSGKFPSIPGGLHLPIQVTLACALAMGAGHLISSDRWYWAVISAFLVFNNTRSRADTALRAFHRSAGTIAGIVAGTLLASLLHGELAGSVAGMLIAFFFAFYYLQTTYSLMTFFITIAIALLYGLMGMFGPDVLMLRLEETIIGSLAGAIVAFFVFPVRASVGAEGALIAYLDTLDDLVSLAGERLRSGQSQDGDPAARSRRLDERYAELALAARPLGAPWSAVTRFGDVREKLLVLSAIAHWGRVLARSAAVSRQRVNPEERERIELLCRDVAAATNVLRGRAARFFERSGDSDITGSAERPRPLPLDEGESAVFAFELILVLLDRAGGTEGGLPSSQPAA